ncbi:MAG: pilus assembly protein PilZ [Hyphomicrobiales bacterium]|nr:pilus assembly protein PilZ [Hyphomicrobiales bacterium]
MAQESTFVGSLQAARTGERFTLIGAELDMRNAMSSFASSVARARKLAAITGKRKHIRVGAKLAGNALLDDGLEFSCETTDVSAGGMALVARVSPRVGQRIVIYLELIGGLNGEVVRVSDLGFAVAFHATLRKRDKIATQLTWLNNRDLLGQESLRAQDRIVPTSRRCRATFANGDWSWTEVVDLSRSGVALTGIQLQVGSDVTIGTTRGKVVRLLPNGFAVEFLRRIPMEQFDGDYVL